MPGNVGASYDWIGFDPRGVGASTPSLHCSRNHFGYNRPSYVPRKPWILRHWLRKSSSYSAACANTAAKRALLPHLTTLDTVRDMEAIRQALGEEKISYYGFSYGTYLGQVYATRYPTRVGRFVLDGVVNPSRVWYAANIDQDRAFDANMKVYWRYLAAHPRAFHLGKRWRAIKRGYYRTLRRLDRRPAAGRRLGPDELADAMLSAGYYVYDWAGLGQDYSALVRRKRGGAMLARYRSEQMGDDNGFAIYNAVQCSDVAWPGWARTRQDSWAVHRRAPFLTWGNTWYNAPCLTWRAPRHARLGVSGRRSPRRCCWSARPETRPRRTPVRWPCATCSPPPRSSRVSAAPRTRARCRGWPASTTRWRTTCAPGSCRRGSPGRALTAAARACCLRARRPQAAGRRRALATRCPRPCVAP